MKSEGTDRDSAHDKSVSSVQGQCLESAGDLSIENNAENSELLVSGTLRVENLSAGKTFAKKIEVGTLGDSDTRYTKIYIGPIKQKLCDLYRKLDALENEMDHGDEILGVNFSLRDISNVPKEKRPELVTILQKREEARFDIEQVKGSLRGLQPEEYSQDFLAVAVAKKIIPPVMIYISDRVLIIDKATGPCDIHWQADTEEIIVRLRKQDDATQ